MGGPAQNLPAGSIYGLWTVLGEKGRNKYGQKTFECICSCGDIVEVNGGSLVTGKSKGCRTCALAEKKHHYRRGDKLRFVYVIATGGYFKIGVTDSPQKRFSSLESSSPYDYKVILLGWNREGLEKELHRMFSDKHHRCEWFSGLTSEAVVSFIRVIGEDNLLYKEPCANPHR